MSSLTVAVETTAVVVGEEMMGKTVQQYGVLVHATIASTAAIVDAGGVDVGALRVRRNGRAAPIIDTWEVLMIGPVKRDFKFVKSWEYFFQVSLSSSENHLIVFCSFKIARNPAGIF